MKEQIFSNWNAFRILRLILGLIIIGQAIYYMDYLFGLLGVMFSAMSILNLGCCWSACSINTKFKSTKEEKLDYEEII